MRRHEMSAGGGDRGVWRDLKIELRLAGYECRVASSGHIGVFNAAGQKVYTLASSASDHRSYRNTLSALRRIIGFEMPRKGSKR